MCVFGFRRAPRAVFFSLGYKSHCFRRQKRRRKAHKKWPFFTFSLTQQIKKEKKDDSTINRARRRECASPESQRQASEPSLHPFFSFLFSNQQRLLLGGRLFFCAVQKCAGGQDRGEKKRGKGKSVVGCPRDE